MRNNTINLSVLPRFGSKEKINWKKSIGYCVDFVFDNIEGQLRIISYNTKTRNLTVDYNNNLNDINVSNFIKCNLSYVVGKKKHGFYYEIDEMIVLENSTIKILEQLRIKKRKHYKYECMKCGYVDTIYEGHLKDKHGCPVCGGSRCLSGYNDLTITDSKIAEFFVDDNYIVNHSIGTKEKGKAKCPNCGFEKWILPSTIKSQGFGCNRCSDGLSFPAKFFTSWLCQLNEEFIPEWNPEWACGKKYDFYLPKRHIIVEVHGKQHFEGGFERAGGNSFENEKENDIFKQKKALENGFSKEEYLVIDGRISEADYLIKSINSSEISRILKGDINWEECSSYAESSLVIKACELWKSGLYNNTEDIARQLGLHRSTIIHMLTRGNRYGWCSYNGIYERNKTLKINSEERKRKILQYDIKGVLLASYSSIAEAELETGCKSANIIECALKHYNTIGGFVWRYADDEEPLEIVINRNYKKVIQYSGSGEKIQEYESVTSAANATGISRNIIDSCARNKRYNVKGGFVWRYENDPFFVEKKDNPRKKKVIQYDLKGNKIKQYSSVVEASKITGIWKENIASAARGKVKTAGGYIWRYENSTIPIEKEHSYIIKKRTIQYTLDLVEVNRFDSVVEASRETGVNKNSISLCANKKLKTAGGYIWRYENEI